MDTSHVTAPTTTEHQASGNMHRNTAVKKIKTLQLKGAILDGQYFEGEAGVKRLSTFPTKEEAQAKVVQLVLSPASNLLRAATSPGSNILGIVKEIQKRLEDGKAIAKTA